MTKLSRLRATLSPRGKAALATYLATFEELGQATAAGASDAEKAAASDECRRATKRVLAALGSAK